MNTTMNTMEYLAITALGPSQNVLTHELIQLAAKNQCNIKESRMTLLGAEFSAILLVQGSWSAIAKLESALLALPKSKDIALHVKRTTLPPYPDNLLPYLVQVVAVENPGVLYEICEFFIGQEIVINDLQTNPFTSSYTRAVMNAIVMSVGIPLNISLSELREHFILLCDDLNVDGILEPEKR